MYGTELPNCAHENTKKIRKFGKKCGLCQKRVWKYWKTKKCLDCKSVLHRSCLAAWEKENNARNSNVGPTTETEATAVTSSAERLVGTRDAPLYVTPTQWPALTNITAVMVDCLRRPEPFTVLVNRGHELTMATLIGLFDLLPLQTRRTPVRPSTRQVDPMQTRRTRDAAAVATQTALRERRDRNLGRLETLEQLRRMIFRCQKV